MFLCNVVLGQFAIKAFVKKVYLTLWQQKQATPSGDRLIEISEIKQKKLALAAYLKL